MTPVLSSSSLPQTALVHDDLVQAGGAERVAAVLHRMYPQAPLYAALYDPRTTLPDFAGADVRTSFLQNWPIASKQFHKLALPYFPAAMEALDLSGYELVISSSSRFAKGVITPPETCHICYCHTPARFAWRPHDYLSRSLSTRLLSPLLVGMLSRLRAWDLQSAHRVDYFVANSYNVARRIRKYYRRDASAVIYPPVDTDRYQPAPLSEVGEHYLVVSRLIGYKRTDLAIDACNRLRLPLHVVGTGPEFGALKRKAGPTVQMLGRLPDTDVAREYARCRALIFAGEEDFGLTPLEAMASGRPVVAYGAGGALETVIDGKTGLFFREQTVDSLCVALTALPQTSFSPEALRAHALRFDTRVFEQQMRQFVQVALTEHRLGYSAGLPMKTASFLEPSDLASVMGLRYSKK